MLASARLSCIKFVDVSLLRVAIWTCVLSMETLLFGSVFGDTASFAGMHYSVMNAKTIVMIVSMLPQVLDSDDISLLEIGSTTEMPTSCICDVYRRCIN